MNLEIFQSPSKYYLLYESLDEGKYDPTLNLTDSTGFDDSVSAKLAIKDSKGHHETQRRSMSVFEEASISSFLMSDNDVLITNLSLLCAHDEVLYKKS